MQSGNGQLLAQFFCLLETKKGCSPLLRAECLPVLSMGYTPERCSLVEMGLKPQREKFKTMGCFREQLSKGSLVSKEKQNQNGNTRAQKKMLH